MTKTATSGNTLEIYPMEFDLDYYIFIILIHTSIKILIPPHEHLRQVISLDRGRDIHLDQI